MKPQATYNWQLSEQKRLRKERIINLIIGVPIAIAVILFIGSVDSIVEIVLNKFGI